MEELSVSDPGLNIPTLLHETLDALEVTALRVKSERDEAIELLRESLLYSATGNRGAFKTRVRDFLARLQ
jgi:hypothetical protein